MLFSILKSKNFWKILENQEILLRVKVVLESSKPAGKLKAFYQICYASMNLSDVLKYSKIGEFKNWRALFAGGTPYNLCSINF